MEENTVSRYGEILSAMRETYRDLTGFDPDGASDIGIRLKVLAEQVALLYGELEELERQSFPQTSAGPALERHAQCRGLTRKPARHAQGILRFSRESPAPADIPIGAGVICATGGEGQLQFVTTEDGVLPAGERRADLPAQAVEPGEEGNVAPGAVRLMVSAAAGLSSVTNPAAFSGGADLEGDEALRARLLHAYRNISNGANPAFYYDLAMNREGVGSAAVLPRARGRGTVDVVIHCSGREEEIAAGLEEEMNRRREVNVDVKVYGAAPRTVALTAQVAVTGDGEFAPVAEACAKAIKAHLEGLGVGRPLLLARLTGELLALDGVYNVAILAPGGDVRPGPGEILCPGSVQVERMAP